MTNPKTVDCAKILQHRWNHRAPSRLGREHLVDRSHALGPTDRALVNAFFGLGMSTIDLATMRGITTRELRRKLNRLENSLGDPAFVLMHQFGDSLPAELHAVAAAYWQEGLTLRQVATRHALTLHRVRAQLNVARSLLVGVRMGQLAPP